MSLYADYCCHHVADDFNTMQKVVFQSGDKNISEAFFKVMYQNNKLRHYNMFIMKWDVFDQYCKWLFGILEKIEINCDISNYSSEQKRIFGYMGERLLNVYIEANKYKVIEKKIIWFNDSSEKKRSALSYLFRSWMFSLGMLLTYPRSLVLRNEEHDVKMI